MNAFDSLRKQTKISKSSVVHVEDLEITNDPVIQRKVSAGKYEQLFSSMKPGQSIKCNPTHVGRISIAMRKWLDKNKLSGCSVSSVTDYGDGFGRVWMLATELKLTPTPPKRRECAEAA